VRAWIAIVTVTAACAAPTTADPAAPAESIVQSAPSSGAGPAGSATVDVVDPVGTVAADAVLPEGFDLVAARVTGADGSVCDLCLWLADDGDRRSRGLMFVTDLGRGDGMAFSYADPQTTNFWMKNTVLPLSIAFFAPDGGYLDAFDMEPCTSDPCPRYPTARSFTVAVETVQGGLPELGMTPGSVLELTDLPCDPG
jgi:uncharacterized membrane protein (UPF0127 family)